MVDIFLSNIDARKVVADDKKKLNTLFHPLIINLSTEPNMNFSIKLILEGVKYSKVVVD